MIFATNEARETARETIRDLIVKLAEMPLDVFPGGLQDEQNIRFYLQTLDAELAREIRTENKHKMVPMPGTERLADLKAQYSN